MLPHTRREVLAKKRSPQTVIKTRKDMVVFVGMDSIDR